MTKSKQMKSVVPLLVALAAVSFLAVGVSAVQYFGDKRSIMRAGEARMMAESAKAAGSIDAVARTLMRDVDAIAAGLSDGTLSEKGLPERLKAVLAVHPRMGSVGVSYIPFGHDAGTQLFSLNYIRTGAGKYVAAAAAAEDASDYTTAEWFGRTIRDGASWFEPCCGDTTETLVTGYAAPFYRPGETGTDRKPVGVVRANIPLSAISAVASTFKLGKTGYGYILSKDGYFIYHPIDEVLAKHKTVFELMKDRPGPHQEKMKGVIKKALKGERASIELTSPATGQAFRAYFQPVPATGWSFGTFFLTSEIFPYDKTFHRRQIWIVLGLILFLGVVSVLAFRAYTMNIRSLWAVAVIFSILCICGTSAIWRFQITMPLTGAGDEVMVADAAALDKFVDGYNQSAALMNNQPPLWVPTGIYVQSLEFSNANDLTVTGYVWQKYTDGVHDAIARGFVMPEAQSFEATEAYRVKGPRDEVIGWRFEATLRESFDHAKYPFDRPAIRLWLKHKDLAHTVMLVPDLGAYKFLSPSARPGLQDETAIPGYVVMGAFFNYDDKVYNTNFGIADQKAFGAVPELAYTIVVKRTIITPFLSRVFPLFILLAILFLVLLTFSKDEEKKRSFGLSGLAVMSVVITFLFTTLIAQSSLRQELGSDKIIYLEGFYFITYLVLLLVAIKTFLFTGNKNIRIVQYEQGLIPKLFYWPVVTGLILLVTVIHFY